MIKISTSILATTNREEAVTKLNQTNSDYLHIDAMDGKFVPNTQFTITEINHLADLSQKPIDLHLMVEDPLLYINNLTSKNISSVTIHIEINQDIKNIINIIKKRSYKVCLAIKPKTNLEELIPYINTIDMILVMSVEPGFGGQEFIPETITRIQKLKTKYPSILIEVDGGIKDSNIKLIEPYTDIAVVGSYITKQNDYNEAINKLKN